MQLKIVIAAERMKLGSYHASKKQYEINNWSVSVTQFKELYLVKHISIFAARQLLIQHFGHTKAKLNGSTIRIGFITRDDDRVINQRDLIEHLSIKWNAKPISKIHLLDFGQKQRLLNSFDILITPPGSDNINAFLFSSKRTYIIQLNPFEVNFEHNNPFHTFACIRYQITEMERIITVGKEPMSNINSDTYKENGQKIR